MGHCIDGALTPMCLDLRVQCQAKGSPTHASTRQLSGYQRSLQAPSTVELRRAVRTATGRPRCKYLPGTAWGSPTPTSPEFKPLMNQGPLPTHYSASAVRRALIAQQPIACLRPGFSIKDTFLVLFHDITSSKGRKVLMLQTDASR